MTTASVNMDLDNLEEKVDVGDITRNKMFVGIMIEQNKDKRCKDVLYLLVSVSPQ